MMEENARDNRKTIHRLWMSFTIKGKFGVFAGAVVFTIALAVCLNILVVNFSLYGFGVILDDNAKCYAFQEAIENETRSFETFVRNRSRENREVSNRII